MKLLKFWPKYHLKVTELPIKKLLSVTVTHSHLPLFVSLVYTTVYSVLLYTNDDRTEIMIIIIIIIVRGNDAGSFLESFWFMREWRVSVN